MKTTLCFLGWAHFSIFPRLAHIGQQPTCDTTVAHPRRIPVPCFRKTRCPPLSCLGWCHGRAPFSPPRAATISPPPPLAPPDLASSLGRTPPPLKSPLCRFEKGPLHRLRSLSPFPLPRGPQAPLCLSLHASCPGSVAANSASLVSAPHAPPYFDPSGPTPTPSPPPGAHRSHRRPPEYLHC
jgi:hypothetical protein